MNGMNAGGCLHGNHSREKLSGVDAHHTGAALVSVLWKLMLTC